MEERVREIKKRRRGDKGGRRRRGRVKQRDRKIDRVRYASRERGGGGGSWEGGEKKEEWQIMTN